jgi:uncharacterized protein YutE (UPF0331/DUF86 family)
VDKDRILKKVDTLNGYLKELRQIFPQQFSEYQKSEKKRASERLLQISIECVLDICSLIVSGLKLGLPGEQDDFFKKLEKTRIIDPSLSRRLKEMKGLRNLLVHEYGEIEDEIIFGILARRLNDFELFKKSILKFLNTSAKWK